MKIYLPYRNVREIFTRSIMKEFERWLEKVEDKEIKNELLSVVGQEKEIEDRFYKSLSFGTGGLRGIIGVSLLIRVSSVRA